jgi:prepilin-type N-terminal cleavage/methylation domain-containing protein/prepilin-type processing-associated H-X9-DG protein
MGSLSHRKAFTLVELLVVIGIIALLISILLPALNKARQQANSVSCLSNLHNMALAMSMYTNQNHGEFPFSTGASDSAGNAIHWGALLSQVMGIGNGTIVSASNANTVSSRAIFLCKDASTYGNNVPLNEYSAHPLLMPNVSLTYPAVSAWGSLQNQQREPYHINRITTPGDIVMIWDGVMSTSDNSTSPDSFSLDLQRITNTNSAPATYLLAPYCQVNNINLGASVDGGPNTDDTSDSTTDRIYGNIRWRHLSNKAANFLFVDGHCATIRYTSELNTGLYRRNICLPMP